MAQNHAENYCSQIFEDAHSLKDLSQLTNSATQTILEGMKNLSLEEELTLVTTNF